MGTLSTTKLPSEAALDGPWTAYRTWAATARYHKDAIDNLTRWSLRLAIGGAVVATLGEQIGPVVPALPWLSKALGAVGAAAIALAAYLSRQAQADDREGIWTRCRSAAESLKSAIFLCRASAPRYQMLIAMYLSTALRLELITGEWAATGKTDRDRAERNTMIQRCEETMASENGSWLALWSKKDSAKASSPTGEQPGQTGQ
jgi:hypothetical protein